MARRFDSIVAYLIIAAVVLVMAGGRSASGRDRADADTGRGVAAAQPSPPDANRNAPPPAAGRRAMRG